MYEEDFKTEREDRVRAFAERNEEGERYRAEIEQLQTQLKSHMGNLCGLEEIHLSRQKELMQTFDDLKKCQEQYKKAKLQQQNLKSEPVDHVSIYMF